MSAGRALLILLCLYSLWCFSVHTAAAAESANAPENATTGPDLSNQVLENFTYRCGLEDGLTLRMRNGLYSEPNQKNDGATQSINANLVLAARGAMPLQWQDSTQDTDVAAVVYVYNTGGSGYFYALSILGPCSDAPEAICERACTPLGDRVQVQSVSIDSGLVSLDMVMHGDADPACCPEKFVTRSFALESGTLQEQNTIQKALPPSTQ